MKILSRALALLVATPATYFLFRVLFPLLPFAEQGWLMPSLISFLVLATGVGWFTGSKLLFVHNELCTSVLLGAIVFGSVGFYGFIAPIILASHTHQRLVLGIASTGLLGYMLGAVGGLIFGLSKGQKGYRS